jgi:Lon protease-like protein
VVSGADPSRGAGERCTAPLFPLPNSFLFPGQRAHMQVFEPRYRQLVRDLLDARGQLVMGVVRDEHLSEFQGQVPIVPPSGIAPPPPAVLPIGGLGEIFRHEELHDGRYLIWLVGLARVHMREVASVRLYRRVEAWRVVEQPVDAAREPALRASLVQAIRQRYRELEELPQDMPIGCLGDLLLRALNLPQSVLGPLYCELDLEKRCRGALQQHAGRP